MDAAAIDDLARSGITPEDAAAGGMFSTADASTLFPEFRKSPALVIPYFDADGKLIRFERDGKSLPFVRIRYLDKLPTAFTGKIQRYTQPQRSGMHAYLSPIIPNWRELLSDPREGIAITEGEKKATAACIAGIPTVAFGGVFNWREHDLLPELAGATWTKKDVFIVFDSDAANNPNILAAEARLVDELQRKRGARCYLVRLPQDGEEKVGIDDYLLAHGPQALAALFNAAPSLSALDAKVVALNQSLAWIEQENMAYDLETQLWIPKESLTVGSRFSSIIHIQPSNQKQRAAPKEISVAKTWLTHPHAQRFSEVLFRPGEGRTVVGAHGRPALNLWTGWESPEPGDVSPWLELYDLLFQSMRAEDKLLPLRLLAYKAQHPEEKIPLALVLIGVQGSGKSLWSNCVMDAFMPYAAPISSQSFHSEFQNWLEKSLIGVIQEAESEDMLKGGDVLKSLISDLERPMNEKFRPVRIINSYTMYILTSNKRAVGAFAPDDRRMIVIDCPVKGPVELYDRVGQWKQARGGRRLLYYLLNYDLKGWRPPARAPMSAEKYMAYIESLSPIARIAEQMQTAGEHSIVTWLHSAYEWGRANELSNTPALAATARAIVVNVGNYQIRPYYTPEELANMFPAVVQQLYGAKMSSTTPAGVISRELREHGIRFLENTDDPRGFMWHGRLQQFLVIAPDARFERPITQAEFDYYSERWPRFKAKP